MLGVRAARANLLPGLVVQLVMLGLVIAYYWYPPTTAWLNSLALIKERWGFVYSVIAAVLAGAFLPEAMRVLVFQKGAITRGNVRNLKYTIPFFLFCIIR